MNIKISTNWDEIWNLKSKQLCLSDGKFTEFHNTAEFQTQKNKLNFKIDFSLIYLIVFCKEAFLLQNCGYVFL